MIYKRQGIQNEKIEGDYVDLFELQAEKNLLKEAPLAERLKPGKLEDYVGQEHILGKGKLLWREL